jgi:hypothetical protein
MPAFQLNEVASIGNPFFEPLRFSERTGATPGTLAGSFPGGGSCRGAN